MKTDAGGDGDRGFGPRPHGDRCREDSGRGERSRPRGTDVISRLEALEEIAPARRDPGPGPLPGRESARGMYLIGSL